MEIPRVRAGFFTVKEIINYGIGGSLLDKVLFPLGNRATFQPYWSLRAKVEERLLLRRGLQCLSELEGRFSAFVPLQVNVRNTKLQKYLFYFVL